MNKIQLIVTFIEINMSKQIISAVVAFNKQRVIGKKNSLPWHIPEDLEHFRNITLNKPIIMGRKTFESINRVLPNRRNIVLTKQKDWSYNNVEIYSSIDEVLKDNINEKELCIIGGGEIFRQTFGIINKMYLTIVDFHVENADVFFPDYDISQWKLNAYSEVVSKNNIKCFFYEYSKILSNVV